MFILPFTSGLTGSKKNIKLPGSDIRMGRKCLIPFCWDTTNLRQIVPAWKLDTGTNPVRISIPVMEGLYKNDPEGKHVMVNMIPYYVIRNRKALDHERHLLASAFKIE
jgi:hypothetical protein